MKVSGSPSLSPRNLQEAGNLRRVVLLNSIRKSLSIVVLGRTRDKVNYFAGLYQSGFKRGRSCTDIVWAQHMPFAVVMHGRKMGLPQNENRLVQSLWYHRQKTSTRCPSSSLRPFSTSLLDAMKMIWDSHEWFLANTRLRVRVNSIMSAESETTIGSLSGNSLS